MDRSKQHRCAVCNDVQKGGGNELKRSPRFNVYVHEKCKTTCVRCRGAKSREGFICDGCERELKAMNAEASAAPVHTASDLSDRARNASKSSVTGKSFPVRVHERDNR